MWFFPSFLHAQANPSRVSSAGKFWSRAIWESESIDGRGKLCCVWKNKWKSLPRKVATPSRALVEPKKKSSAPPTQQQGKLSSNSTIHTNTSESLVSSLLCSLSASTRRGRRGEEKRKKMCESNIKKEGFSWKIQWATNIFFRFRCEFQELIFAQCIPRAVQSVFNCKFTQFVIPTLLSLHRKKIYTKNSKKISFAFIHSILSLRPQKR